MISVAEECLCEMGHTQHFDKKDIRILWNLNDQGTIENLIVAPFRDAEENQFLYKHFNLDLGNCIAGWENWCLADVLIKLFVFYGINESRCSEKRINILIELCKVTEWRELIAPWIYRYYN